MYVSITHWESLTNSLTDYKLFVCVLVCVLNTAGPLELILDNRICQSISALCLYQLLISVCKYPPVMDYSDYQNCLFTPITVCLSLK